MRIGKIPDQVIRLGVLLLMAVAILVLARARFIPESFGELGHYRADALQTIAGQDIQYAGWQVCVDCHDEQGEAKRSSFHRTLSCEVCHGPAYLHAEDFEAQTPVTPRERGAACLFCHEYLPSRPTGFPQIVERVHNPLQPCVGCHEPHDPTPPEVPETCSACHTQISRMKAVSHHGPLACETCHETPAEHSERPRSYRANKPADRELCGRCHATGADSPSDIPRVDPVTHGQRYLCWQCHYPHFPEI